MDQTSKSRVLVVDDEPDLAGPLAVLLEGEGYAVETAENGEVAWSILRTRAFGLVLCDMQMPVLDGVGLFKRVAADPAVAPTPFLFMSAMSRANVTRFLGGAYPFVQKPFRIDDLFDAVRTHIRGADDDHRDR